MNIKLVTTVLTATFVSGVALYSAYRIGEEVGKQQTENEFLEKLKQIEAKSLAEEAEEQATEIKEEKLNTEPITSAKISSLDIDDIISDIEPDDMNQVWEDLVDSLPKGNGTISEVYKEKFKEVHPYEASDTKTTQEDTTMQADNIYFNNALRYIESEATKGLLLELDEYYVEKGPAIDQIMWENSLDKRNTIRDQKGLAPISIPTWFDMYQYFLRDFEDEPELINKKVQDLMFVWADYTTNYGEVAIEEVLYAFSYNLVPAGSHYSPFGLSQSQVDFLEGNYRNNLSGQKNEWINVESPLI